MHVKLVHFVGKIKLPSETDQQSVEKLDMIKNFFGIWNETRLDP